MGVCRDVAGAALSKLAVSRSVRRTQRKGANSRDGGVAATLPRWREPPAHWDRDRLRRPSTALRAHGREGSRTSAVRGDEPNTLIGPPALTTGRPAILPGNRECGS